jgi:hypothetical protein
MTEHSEALEQKALEQNRKDLLQIWEKCVDVQTHFNEMCMNIRRTAIGTLGALVAVGAIAFRFGGVALLFDRTVSVAFLFSALALFCWFAFYLLDRFWYHQLLRAAVRYAESLEPTARALNLVVPLSMTREIREANRRSLRLTGSMKLDLFYGSISVVLASVTCALWSGGFRPIV